MSDSPMSSEDILELQSWLVGNYVQISSSSLWMIDFVQTLPMEIGSVWSRKLTGTAMLLLLNRYGFLIYQIVSIFYTIPGTLSDLSCKSNSTLLDFLGILLTANTGLLFAFRVYAIYDRSKAIIAVSGLLILSRAAFDITALAMHIQTEVWLPASRDHVGVSSFLSTQTRALFYRLILDWPITAQLSTPVIGLVFDIFVFTLTVKKTLHHVIEMQRNGQSGITSVFLRDGSLYFIAAFLIGAATTTVYAVSISGDDYTDVLTPYFVIMPNLLINRLMLNLRCYQNQDASGTTADGLPVNDPSEIKFAQNRWLGNIGEPLNPNQWESQFDDDAEIYVEEAEPNAVTTISTA